MVKQIYPEPTVGGLIFNPAGELFLMQSHKWWGKWVVPGGHIMIFDNRGNGGASRVVEFDPVELRIVWVYAGDPPGSFFSRECGSNQRLPNGNTLITESDRGKAFEVTPDGTIVWKYINPAQAGDDREYIASLFEVVRLPAGFPTDWAGPR